MLKREVLVIQKIKGREKVITVAKDKINFLMKEIENLIKGAESEYLFYLVYNLQNLLAARATKRKIDEHYFVHDIKWFRATNGLTLALNRLLPKFLPLKHVLMLNVKKFEKTFEGNLLHLLDTCYKMGVWSYILENKYVDRIAIENGEVKPYYNKRHSSIFQEYVNKVAVDEGYAHWLSWFYNRLRENHKLINALDTYFQRNYKFTFDDIVTSSSYLGRLTESDKVIISRNEVHRVFSENIRSGRAETLLKELTFDDVGKDLYRSPLIPLKGGYFLIAKWVFSLRMHFEAWVRPAIESVEIYGIYSDFIGKIFEEYVKDLIKPLVDTVQSNIKITREKYPDIKDEFEVDILAVKGELAFLISCKGGKKELPKLQISKMWAEFPEEEIKYRVRENKKEIKEMKVEYEYITLNKRIVKDLGLEGKRITPLLVYSTVQPLSLKKLREAYNVHPLVLIVSAQELKNVIAS